MTHVPPGRWWTVVAAVGLAAATAGLLPEPIGRAAAARGMHHSLGILLVVNVVLPGLIVAGACYYPRLRLVPVLAAAGLVGFTVSRMLLRDWRFWGWTPRFIVDVVHPIAAAACVVGAVIGVIAALAVRQVRVVGRPPGACPRCGYPPGKDGGTCPECGLVQ